MNLRLFFILLLVCNSCIAQYDAEWLLSSPRKKLGLHLQICNGEIQYDLKKGTESVLQGNGWGFVFSIEDTLHRFRCFGFDTLTCEESWQPLWGTASKIENRYLEIKLKLQELNPATGGLKNNKGAFTAEIRLYDEGMAYRLHFDDGTKDSVMVLAELGNVCFEENGSSHWFWADYHTLEKKYFHTPLSAASHVALPFTTQYQAGTCISLLEAGLINYPMLSYQADSLKLLTFRTHLCPWGDGNSLKTTAPFSTPWRVALITKNPGGLIESNLILNLNPPPDPAIDFSWVKPIRYIGVWWEMHLGISEWKCDSGRHGANTENVKRYIDFAAKNGIEGVLIEGWNTGWENWGKKDAFDFITPASDLNLQEAVAYARAKGVEIIGHHETGGDILAYERHLDSAFAFYNRMGIRYVKTGYAGPVNPPTEMHHGQYMVNHFNKVMETAARYHIMLDVHEPVIPSGLSRTWPNLMTFEAVRGMEWNAWSEGNSPYHVCTLPFTRALAGPIDYTPGIFDIGFKNHASKRVKWNGPAEGETAVHSTLAHQAALPVVIYSPLQMFSDLPDNYERYPEVFELMRQIPSAWDETRVIDASIGEYVAIARRKGKDWFVGIITDQKREIHFKPAFLDRGHFYRYNACLDGAGAHFEKWPTSHRLEQSVKQSSDEVRIQLAEGGGALLIFKWK